MARSALSDLLQVYPFWIMDAGPSEAFSLPLFTPIFGFSTITSPEISVETRDINEGNWPYTKKVVCRASVGNIVLTRGITFADADFWRWIIAAIEGSTGGIAVGGTGLLNIGGPTYRRRMLLIHFFARNPFGTPEAAIAATALGLAGIEAVAPSVFGVAGAGTNVVFAALQGLGAPAPGPFEFAARVPAKAYMLYGCIPVRYKTGTDFDASSGAVSIAELEMAVEAIEEYSLTS
jgi:hypothetical protein